MKSNPIVITVAALIVLCIIIGNSWAFKATTVKARWPLDGTVLELPVKARWSESYDYKNYGYAHFSRYGKSLVPWEDKDIDDLFEYCRSDLEAKGATFIKYDIGSPDSRDGGYLIALPNDQGYQMYFCMEHYKWSSFYFEPMVIKETLSSGERKGLSIPWLRHLAYDGETALGLEESIEKFVEFYESIGVYDVIVDDNTMTVTGDDTYLAVTFEVQNGVTHVEYSIDPEPESSVRYITITPINTQPSTDEDSLDTP